MQISLPKLKAITDKDFPNTPKKITAWLLEVENLDVSVRIKEFYQLILKINRCGLAPKDHIELLEMLRPTAAFCIEQLQKRYVKAQLPLSQKALPVFKLALTLCNEMALGYKVCAVSLIEKKSFFGGSAIQQSCARTMYYLNLVLLRYSEIYTGVQGSVWQDLNALYLKSLELKIHTKKIDELNNTKTTIETLFKKAALFSLSNPYSLRRGEAQKLFNGLDEWVDQFQLKSAIKKSDTNNFMIDLSSKAAPDCVDEEEVDKKHSVFIVLDNLITETEKITEATKDDGLQLIQDDNLNVTALSRLQKNWIKRENLRLDRKSKTSKVTIEVGLINISDHILEDLVEADDPFADMDEDDDGDDGLALESGSSEADNNYLMGANNAEDSSEVDDVWESVSRGNVLTPQYEKELLKKRKERTLLKKISKDHVWTMQNVSSSGYNLHWTGTSSPSANVGEIIGLRDGKSANADWHIAIIRWLQYKSDTEFNIGVQAISNQAIIAKASRTTGKEDLDKVQQNCLLLPAIKSVNQPLTLLVPAFMYAINEVLSLDINEEHQAVSIVSVYEHTGSFTQFIIEPAKNKIKQSGDAITEEVSDEFNSVWGEL